MEQSRRGKSARCRNSIIVEAFASVVSAHVEDNTRIRVLIRARERHTLRELQRTVSDDLELDA